MIATKLETWKRTQKKNEKRRAVAKRKVQHRRLMNKTAPKQPSTIRIIPDQKTVRASERVLQTAEPKKSGVFSKVMNMFKSQRGN